MALDSEPFDAAEFLTNEATISAYLTEALDSGDPREFAQALGDVARARGGMTQLAKETGIASEALHRALGQDGDPELGTILKVMRALKVTLTATVSVSDTVAA